MTGWDQVRADARLLCLHQTVEGAQVGTVNYTFRSGLDVVRGEDIPGGFAAVLAGHIHRNQVLTHDLGGRPMAAPVIYPGSVERTSFAERNEGKHYAIVEIEPTGDGVGRLAEASFVPLPARPMVDLVVEGGGLGAEALSRRIRTELASLDPDSVVRIEVTGPLPPPAAQVLRAENLRALAPSSMNITQKFVRTKR
jgi:DNA repair exonuclease SbcCD nuclease subunit